MISRKLTPSDFAFLWEECKRCFYLKVVLGFVRPRPTMPKIFTIIDGAMKAQYKGVRNETIAAGIPPGFVQYDEKWVGSKPIQRPGWKSSCFITGKFDTVLGFDDGSYGVVDFKTSQTKSTHVPLYARQLHAYAYALENPAEGKFALTPISCLGLLVFDPNTFSHQLGQEAKLTGPVSWLEVPRNDIQFFDFLDEVVAVLDSKDVPPSSEECEWCSYRLKGRSHMV